MLGRVGAAEELSIAHVHVARRVATRYLSASRPAAAHIERLSRCGGRGGLFLGSEVSFSAYPNHQPFVPIGELTSVRSRVPDERFDARL
jgi:hypothetical protein